MLQAIRDKGKNPYPHKFNRNMRIDEFVTKYEAMCDLEKKGDFLETEEAHLTGRIMLIRPQGQKLIFIDLHGDEAQVQVFAQADNYKGEDFTELHHTLRRGDVVGVTGNPGRTKTGQLSIRPTNIVPLSYCLHQLPTPHAIEKQGLTKDTRYRTRHLDLLVNQHVRKIFKVRNMVIDEIRQFLN